MYTILIVDDEANLLEVLAVALENMGYGTVTAETAEEALAVLEEREVHLVLSDLRLPGLNGRELMEKVKAANPDLPVVIMTAYASLKEAVEIIKEGAFDYTVKPFELDALEATIASALRYYALGRDNRDLREQLQTASAGQFVGQSPAYLALLRNVSEVSASSANVLITGESGTGKEVVAKAIHYGGPRAKAPLVTINCAAIPEQLLESELFGHARGAFTGATSNRKGRFAQADGGTLFLDEIGDMPLALQAKILRCIQEKAIEPVGSNTTQKVDVRIIAATNQNLVEAIEKGKFRRDLYYRLNVYPIIMPSLRERKEDIPLLAEHFALRAAGEMGKVPVTFTEAALDILKNHTWPGNIRELENCIERLTIIASGTAITPERLASCAVPGGGDASSPSAPGSAFPLDLDRKLAETERDLILRALEETGGVQVKAAELLNISERSMWHRIKKLGINITTVAASELYESLSERNRPRTPRSPCRRWYRWHQRHRRRARAAMPFRGGLPPFLPARPAGPAPARRASPRRVRDGIRNPTLRRHGMERRSVHPLQALPNPPLRRGTHPRRGRQREQLPLQGLRPGLAAVPHDHL